MYTVDVRANMSKHRKLFNTWLTTYHQGNTALCNLYVLISRSVPLYLTNEEEPCLVSFSLNFLSLNLFYWFSLQVNRKNSENQRCHLRDQSMSLSTREAKWFRYFRKRCLYEKDMEEKLSWNLYFIYIYIYMSLWSEIQLSLQIL